MDFKKAFFLFLGIALGAVTFLIPFPLEFQAKVVLAIIVFAMTYWVSEALPLHVTGLLTSFLLIVLTGLSPQKVFAPYFDPVIVLLLGGFVLAVAMQKHSLDELFAIKILNRVGTSPKFVLLGVMSVAFFLSMWISNTATAAVILPIAIVIIARNNLPILKSNFARSLVLGVAFSATIGGIATLIGTTPNIMAVKFLGQANISLSFLDWMLYALPFSVILLFVAWLVLLIVFKPEIKKVKRLNKKFFFDFGKKKVLLVFVLTILLWLTTSIHNTDASTIALVPIILLYLIGSLNTKDFKAIDWPTLILIGAGLSLGLAIQESKLDLYFASGLQAVIINQTFFFALLAIAAFAVIFTIFTSNTAAAAVTLPFVIPLSNVLGFDVKAVVVLVAICLSLDFVVPIGTPPNAIAYSSGYIRVKDMARAGIILSTLALLIVTSFAMFW